MNKETIPQQVRKAAAWYRRNCPGAEVVHLGDYRGEDTYYVRMPEETVTGFPPVFVLRDGKAVEINGEESLGIISGFFPSEEEI